MGIGAITGLGGAAALAISGTACELGTDPDADDRVVGSGVITETRDVSKFHGVDVTGVAEIVLEQTGEESVSSSIMPPAARPLSRSGSNQILGEGVPFTICGA